MTKKFLLLIVAILMGGMTAIQAKINYVPLYIVDTQPDVKVVKRAPAAPMFITQDDHKLTLPELEDSLTFMMLKDSVCVYTAPYEHNQTTIYLPTTFVGDFEVRLCADTYFCYGFITLEDSTGNDSIPSGTDILNNITLRENNTLLQEILDKVMRLEVVEYDKTEYINGEEVTQRNLGFVGSKLYEVFPHMTEARIDGKYSFNIGAFFPILIRCIQELKTQLDIRTEKIVDIMMSRGTGPSAVREVRAALGSTLLSVSTSSVSEPATVRYLLGDDATNAYLVVTDMGGRTMKKVPVSPSDTSASIGSGTLGEGIFLCTLLVNGENVDTKRLVKTK